MQHRARRSSDSTAISLYELQEKHRQAPFPPSSRTVTQASYPAPSPAMFSEGKHRAAHTKNTTSHHRLTAVALAGSAVALCGAGGAAAGTITAASPAFAAEPSSLASTTTPHTPRAVLSSVSTTRDTTSTTSPSTTEAASNGAVESSSPSSASIATSDASATTEKSTESTSTNLSNTAGTSTLSADTPQVLELSEYKPVEDIADQVSKVLEYESERVAADLAARMPTTVKPAEGTLTSTFGERWGTVHEGIDIANALGTTIVAAQSGTVIDAGPASGFGNWVRILHDDGTITVYGHMSVVEVEVGQSVTAGEEIAKMGSQGFSTGSHLHFEVHPNGGAAIDPLPWLNERGITV